MSRRELKRKERGDSPWQKRVLDEAELQNIVAMEHKQRGGIRILLLQVEHGEEARGRKDW